MNPTLDLFADNPIIAAVKDEVQLAHAIASDCQIIFLLFGSICSVGGLVRRAKEAGKTVFVHLDLTSGLSAKEIAADFIRETTPADGVISTRPAVLRHAKSLGLLTVLRVFVVDSLSLSSLQKQQESCGADLVEIMPGVMPRILQKIRGQLRVPIITGGLIFDKKDVIEALSAGAQCVSTTCESLWDLD